MTPANLIHPGGEISKPLVDTNLAGDGLYVGCREQFRSYAVPLKRMPGTSFPSDLVTMIYWYSGRCSSIQCALAYPVTDSSKRAVACGRYWLELAPVSSAGADADAGAGTAFGLDFNKTSAVWTMIDAWPEVAGALSPAAGFGGSSRGGSAKVPGAIVFTSK